METSMEPHPLKLVPNGCHPSQWPMRARFNGEPLAIFIEWWKVSKHPGHITIFKLSIPSGEAVK